MKNFVAFCLFLSLTLPVLAVENGQAMYVGGSAPGVNAGVAGKLDTTSETALIFEYSGNKLEIPYSAIQSFEYSREVTRHLGALPMVAVGMFKMQSHRHFLCISYRDSNSVEQAIVLEVPNKCRGLC
jgi:hypothetical protein